VRTNGKVSAGFPVRLFFGSSFGKSERWRRVLDAIGTFLDRWAAAAVKCGWSDLDLFGVNAAAPDPRFDRMRLVMLLDRCEVTEINESGADLLLGGGVTQRYERKLRPVGTVSLWSGEVTDRARLLCHFRHGSVA
jgi:hypothetical protein